LLLFEPGIAGLDIFVTLIFFLMSGFAFYQTYLVAIGVTTNEAFKWDDLKYAMQTGQVEVIETEETEKPGASDPPLLRKAENLKRGEKNIPYSELVNIYDKGYIGNLKEMLFPKRF
jgi:palmitoyltransferase